MAGFIGRNSELQELKHLFHKKTASLVVIKGRRRIGKSRLIEEFAKDEIFYSFSGIPPTKYTTQQSELDEFTKQLSVQTGMPEVKVDDWSKAFLLLKERIKKKRTIILFDEISWMGSKDPDFLGKLKNIWDVYFKKHPNLILVLCGSVSAWIEKNIINSTGFLGRLSLSMTLDELSLPECNQFWNSLSNEISAFEKFKIISVTGGIPRYLELIDPRMPAEHNIKRLCFSKNGPLVNEFEHIFTDIFSKRSGLYKKMVEKLVQGPLAADELAAKVRMTRTGTFDDYLNDLLLSGFIARDYTWHIHTGQLSKLSRYRLKDNYTRFYLKYIRPNKPRIEKGHFKEASLMSLSGLETIMGLQFENVVLNNHHHVIKQLGLRPEEVLFDNPYYQRTTIRHDGCQIDYLIQTKFDTVYACEIKFSKYPIKADVIAEMKEKLRRLNVPRNVSRRAVLIHVNGVVDEVIESEYFSHIIDFSKLLEMN